MASLRNASPWLRNYFKENYIPQVCEVREHLGGGVRRGRNGKGFPRGGLGFGGVREWRGGREWKRTKSALVRSGLKLETREKAEVVERGEWLTSPRRKSAGPQARNSKLQL